MEMNHRRLCEIGAQFLKRPESANGHGCHFVIIEASCYGENPDVFGVRHGLYGNREGTYLLEAKMSRSDFLVDKNKPHRVDPSQGMGQYRYYICPNDLIKPDELPERWGLIYVSPKGRCKVIKGCLDVPREKHEGWSGQVTYFRPYGKVEENSKLYEFTERNVQNEMNLLTMALARLGDAEQLLYMQRNQMKLQTQNDEFQRRLDSKNREIERLKYKLERSTDTAIPRVSKENG